MANISDSCLNIQLAQINPLVGDMEGNTNHIIQCWRAAEQAKADILLLPELAITGYPPEDLLYRDALYERVNIALERLQKEENSCILIVGAPEKKDNLLYNAAYVIENKKISKKYYKQALPNYTVFDEKRYFTAGKDSCVFAVKGINVGVIICEDLWESSLPLQQSVGAGAEIILSLNASPFARRKDNERLKLLQERSQEQNVAIVYVNCVGGQDELVFDGGSIAVNEKGETVLSAPYYKEAQPILQVQRQADNSLTMQSDSICDIPDKTSMLYQALVLGVHDYVHKNAFPGVLIGLSGGIDSALMLAIAVDALGPDKVTAVSMPSQYTADMSNDDAKLQAENMQVDFFSMPIESIYHNFINELKPHLHGKEEDTTEQNIQARVRGTLLMALSNKHGSMVLTTGNKSEMAVGYSTLYGDMAGGFAALKDIPKTQVYKLARWRNQQSQKARAIDIIPTRVIERAPSAELAPEQKDADTLPPYSELDAIIEAYIDDKLSYSDIVKKGFNPETTRKIITMINRNEYKRRQAPIGIRTSVSAFGKDRRYPITSGFSRVLWDEHKSFTTIKES